MSEMTSPEFATQLAPPEPTPHRIEYSLQQEIAVLREALQGLTARGTSSSALAKPPFFDGTNRNECGTFVSHLKLYIAGNIGQFPDDGSKVAFAMSYLRGQAFAWAEPHLIRDSPILTDWEGFLSALTDNLGDHDRVRTLTRQLQTLVQTGSAAVYSSTFSKISSLLGWNDVALRAQFYAGLKSEVKDALAMLPEDPKDLNALSEMAIRLDNRIYERKMDKKRNTSSLEDKKYYSNKDTGVRPTLRPVLQNDPMDIDINATSGQRFKSLDAEEKKRRFDNNLCLYCGAAGHKAVTCPAKRSRAAAQSGDTGVPMSKN